MLFLCSVILGVTAGDEKPSVAKAAVLSAPTALDACDNAAKQASTGMMATLSAGPTDHVDFGKNGGSCACRYCNGVEALHKPQHVVTDASAPLCLSADPHPPMFKEDSHPAYHCTYPSSLANGDMKTYPTDAQAKQLADKCLAADPGSRGSGAKKRVFLLGDSHALNLVPPLAAAVHGDGYLRTLTATGRGFLAPSSDKRLDDFQTEGKGMDFTGSTAQYRNSAIAALNASVTAGDVVIVHNYWQDDEDAVHAKYYAEAIVSKITQPRNAHFVVMSDFGFAGCDFKGHSCVHQGVQRRAEQCFKNNAWEDCAAKSKQFGARPGAGMKSMTDQYSNAHFFDTYDLFVNPQSSEISINLPGTGIIWQATDHIDCDNLDASAPDSGFSSHMSLSGALYLWPFFCDMLSNMN